MNADILFPWWLWAVVYCLLFDLMVSYYRMSADTASYLNLSSKYRPHREVYEFMRTRSDWMPVIVFEPIKRTEKVMPLQIQQSMYKVQRSDQDNHNEGPSGTAAT